MSFERQKKNRAKIEREVLRVVLVSIVARIVVER